MECHIEIFIDGRWVTAAVFEPIPRTLDQGVGGGGLLQYDIDYAVPYLGDKSAEVIPGLTVGFELFRYEQWPAVIVDLLPGGAGRRAWLRRMQAEKDGSHMDWHLLVKGAGAPPGNLRIAEAVPSPPSDPFKVGFVRRDIIEQQERFLDYAEERGAYVAGASSVQGEAPKYLLVEDDVGLFHAEGAVLRTGTQVRLSPLFDFAPMFLDPEDIGRVSRWDDERPGSQPEWAVICEKFKDLMPPIETRTWLADLSKEVRRLPDTMEHRHVDDDIIQRLADWIDEVSAGLAEARPRM